MNPYFLGWTNEFNVINSVLSAASGLVNVYELENEQEINLAPFTAQARYMYDNALPQSAGLPAGSIVNVISNLRSLMSAHGFDSGRVNWSSVGSDSTSSSFNCTNIYTDWSRNFATDEVAQAINGGYIGINNDASLTNQLLCGGSNLASMFVAPVYSSQPDIVDIHMYPSIAGTTNTDAQIQAAATTDYGDVPHFLTLTGLGSADIVIGETWGGTINTGLVPGGGGAYCWLGAYAAPVGSPNDNVAGFNSSSLASYTVTFRPWMNLEDASGGCFAYGGGPSSGSNYQNINYLGLGPYTPVFY